MIRVLVIDDADTPEFLDKMSREIEGGHHVEVSIEHINPAEFISEDGAEAEINSLLQTIRQRAAECWDVVIIDIRLHEIPRPEQELLDVSLSIAENFRNQNRAAIVFLYSGNLSKSIPKLIEQDASSRKRPSSHAPHCAGSMQADSPPPAPVATEGRTNTRSPSAVKWLRDGASF